LLLHPWLEIAIMQGTNYLYERHRPKDHSHCEQPTIVLLSGLFGGGWIWDSTWKALTEDHDYDVVRFPDSLARLDVTVDSVVIWRNWLLESLNTAEITRPILCGNSLGGLIVIDFAAAFPERVKAIIASGAPGMTRTGLLNVAGFGSMLSLPNASVVAQRMFHNPKVMTPELADRAFAEVKCPKRFRASLRALRVSQEYDASAILPNICCPVLFVWGAEDRITPLEDWMPHLGKLERFELVQIEECGHSPMIEKPAEFNCALLAFLEALDGFKPAVWTAS
jgi:2-hydroxy-6-oxonona-2,4-dienedioate hydrolase